MGICTSCYSGTTTGSSNPATVKLILLDGQLIEFSSPVKVFLVAPPLDLQNNDLCSFICNADEMDFDQNLTAMNGEDDLRLGQLYFELPMSWLNRRLAAEDMASLAVKASRAVTVSSSSSSNGKVRCGCCVKRVDPVVLFGHGDEMITSSWSRVDGDGGKRRMFTRLERIVEE